MSRTILIARDKTRLSRARSAIMAQRWWLAETRKGRGGLPDWISEKINLKLTTHFILLLYYPTSLLTKDVFNHVFLVFSKEIKRNGEHDSFPNWMRNKHKKIT